ncbi:hypothetical protein N7509_000507 [Penicillium cosmopolitanum]|uniref:Uncharacterized protein n=1 Tax=Penicillium cosmopolitanum TaxID=1131564 RepID=A0A9W9WAM1_9EURO|nr:uncharacterized protein N7509_000507 [Penicillium cosmopolitanum]KAJ5413880.1 hypothetical protein N7509_000507 [Penicillium cosmopolitanum]
MIGHAPNSSNSLENEAWHSLWGQECPSRTFSLNPRPVCENEDWQPSESTTISQPDAIISHSLLGQECPSRTFSLNPRPVCDNKDWQPSESTTISQPDAIISHSLCGQECSSRTFSPDPRPVCENETWQLSKSTNLSQPESIISHSLWGQECPSRTFGPNSNPVRTYSKLGTMEGEFGSSHQGRWSDRQSEHSEAESEAEAEPVRPTPTTSKRSKKTPVVAVVDKGKSKDDRRRSFILTYPVLAGTNSDEQDGYREFTNPDDLQAFLQADPKPYEQLFDDQDEVITRLNETRETRKGHAADHEVRMSIKRQVDRYLRQLRETEAEGDHLQHELNTPRELSAVKRPLKLLAIIDPDRAPEDRN